MIKYNLFQKEKAPNHNDSNLVTLQFGEPKIWEEQNNEENCVSVNVVQFARLATYFEYIYIYSNFMLVLYIYTYIYKTNIKYIYIKLT